MSRAIDHEKNYLILVALASLLEIDVIDEDFDVVFKAVHELKAKTEISCREQ